MNYYKRTNNRVYDEAVGGLIMLAGIFAGIWFALYLFALILQFIMTHIGMILLIILGLIALTGFKSIPPGHKGLKIRFGARTNEEVGEGISWKIPLIERIEIVDCRKRFISQKPLTVTLGNLIPVHVVVSIYYKVNNLYNYFENYSLTDFEQKITSETVANHKGNAPRSPRKYNR